MIRRCHGRRRGRRRGAVLVLVLMLMVFVVALALALGREVRVELSVASAQVDQVRLRALCDSAIDRALAELRLDVIPGDTLREPWRDDESIFRAAPRDGARVWWLLVEPDPGDGREVRFGLRDEASKLDVNFATRDQLLMLPGITDEAVDAILDWRDEDDDPNDLGAESAYYGALSPPYLAKNSFIESLDELRRVRGVDDLMLYGEDRNRNGVLDPGEDDGDRSFPPDDADGFLDRGLIDYLTVYARDPNVRQDGEPRLVWNATNPGELRQRLEAAGMEQLALDRLLTMKSTNMQTSSLAPLVIFPEIDEAAARIVLEELTVVEGAVVPGRINVNTAARPILAGLPGLEHEDVEAIMSARLEAQRDLSSPAWLLPVIGQEKFAGVVDLVTCRSEQFTVHVVALLENGRFMRVEALVDRSVPPIRVLTRRDVTHLGFPFPGERGAGSP
ncbi:MAG: general secretion pathway protein GspK [Planctomycetes bacterium]|nr:general secretion pathway protein GspK [Planctomycetota bacterium]